MCIRDSAVPSEEAAIQINPLPEAVSKDKETARLYFGYMQEALLIGEVRVFSVPINENSEASIIAELIKGPSTARTDLTQLINPNTKVVNVTQDGTFLSVTLSQDFLTPPEDTSADGTENEAYEKTRKMLAAYSIVNTIVEQGNFSRVQIYIDDDGTGTGRPLTLEEAGLDGEGTTEALERKGDLDLNGRNTLREIMSCIENKDWNMLYLSLIHIYPVKTFKDMLQMFGAHPDSIVFNTYGSLAAMMLCRHKHMTAVACIFNCIFNQIIDCLP